MHVISKYLFSPTNSTFEENLFIKNKHGIINLIIIRISNETKWFNKRKRKKRPRNEISNLIWLIQFVIFGANRCSKRTASRIGVERGRSLELGKSIKIN